MSVLCVDDWRLGLRQLEARQLYRHQEIEHITYYAVIRSG